MSGFADRFGREPEVRAQAPGRVNLIGEHTDYNGGFVLPTPIPRRTTVELAIRGDRRVRLASASVPPPDMVEYELGLEMRREDWADYARGATRILEQEGCALAGFDAFIASELPIGGGLSSSAALCVALQRALRERFALALDDVALARIAQRAENEFV
ncbi:MAG TPA: galactokinase family protein, partial [Candidatus Eisenbacteria bacterium]|nr:galactokinase family protein [Candidatus Eisenbacteria bacterium]